MEDHQVIIPLMGEFNCSDPITSDCEKDMKEVIVMEESPSRYINYMVVLSTILCLVLVIFPTLKTTSYGANFMAEYQNILMHSIVYLVTFIQIKLFSITTMHPFQTSIFGIIFIIMLSSLTPLVEGSLFLWILWAIIIAALVNALRKWISRLKILYSQNKSRSS